MTTISRHINAGMPINEQRYSENVFVRLGIIASYQTKPWYRLPRAEKGNDSAGHKNGVPHAKEAGR
jgi:hypothetical protein